MKLKQTLIISILLTSIILLVPTINAQVTIGSGQKPVSGALLDLKQEGTTTKGMMLPRVKLADVDKLQMGSNIILDGDHGGDQYNKHTGLWIYHVSGEAKPQCAAIPDGVYVWDGAKWNGIGVNKSARLNLSVDKYELHFASGHDNRGSATTAQTVNIDWAPTDLPLPWTKTDATVSLGGLQFTGNPLEASTSFTGGSKAFTIHPDVMPAPTDPLNSPWQSRETKFKVELTTECGTISRQVVANQTNYAIKVNNSFGDSNYAPITTAGFTRIPTTGNARWAAKKLTDPNGTIVQFTNMPSPPGPSSGVGSDLGDGTTETKELIALMASNSTTKYGSATIQFYDTQTPQRFNPITVTTTSCLGTGVHASNMHKVAGITTSQASIDVPSGQDARTIGGSLFNLWWAPTNMQLSSSATSSNGLNLVPFIANPIPASWPANSTQPQSVSLNPDAMTLPEIALNPWRSKELSLNLNVIDECGATSTKSVIVNQTNYALKVNNSINHTIIDHGATTTGTFSFPVQTNVKWTTSIENSSNIIVLPTTPNIGAITGNDINTGVANSPVNFTYTIQAGSGRRYNSSTITFKDAATISRAKDVEVVIKQEGTCTTTSDPTIPEWKTIGGLDNIAEGVPHPATGVAWHKNIDGSGSVIFYHPIFFSADFGPAGRWMTCNVTRANFDIVGRTGSDNLVSSSVRSKSNGTLQNIMFNDITTPY